MGLAQMDEREEEAVRAFKEEFRKEKVTKRISKASKFVTIVEILGWVAFVTTMVLSFFGLR